MSAKSLVVALIALASSPFALGEPLAEFIFPPDNPPTKSCHASTIAETENGLVAAWFGGTAEGNKDVGIWISLHRNDRWTAPVEVANGLQPDGSRHPAWNPVLFQAPGGPLLLFYKVGSSPSTWWGMLIASDDEGKSWSTPRRLPDGIAGPIKNKPVLLADGTLLCPTSTEDQGWRLHMEMTNDWGKMWTKTETLNDGKTFGAIQPTILDHGSGGIQILCRTKQKVIADSWSRDGGKTWSALAATSLPNPNSGIDAVMLKDGRSLLVYNHTAKGRSPLNMAVSVDGKIWKAGPTLESEPGEYSYPAVIQTSDGMVHITYTWKRARIKHVVLDPSTLELKDMRDAGK
jgi:predicted neuraminidase